jgi:hypothetical protein
LDFQAIPTTRLLRYARNDGLGIAARLKENVRARRILMRQSAGAMLIADGSLESSVEALSHDVSPLPGSSLRHLVADKGLQASLNCLPLFR